MQDLRQVFRGSSLQCFYAIQVPKDVRTYYKNKRVTFSNVFYLNLQALTNLQIFTPKTTLINTVAFLAATTISSCGKEILKKKPLQMLCFYL